MKNTRRFVSLTFVLMMCVIGWTGCSRTGCTDVNSCNYDSKAKTNDGSCINKGKVTFWRATGSGSNNITVTINATTATITSTLGSTPLCDASGCANFSLCPGSHAYTAQESFPGLESWSGNVTVSEDGCVAILLN